MGLTDFSALERNTFGQVLRHVDSVERVGIEHTDS